MDTFPMEYIWNRSANERARMAVVLHNMAFALEADEENGKGELQANMAVHACQAWVNEPNTWTVFEGWVHFSAGPNSVFTRNYPESWLAAEQLDRERKAEHEKLLSMNKK